MFTKFFQQLRSKRLAKQLRRPRGIMGGKVGNRMNKANSFLYDFTFDLLKPVKNDSILEIGFGNGKFFDKIFSLAEELTVTGLDYSSSMLNAARKNNKETIANDKLCLHLGSSDKLPFDDNSFDKVFCINVIYFWDQPHPHLQEIKRVLKPGGRLYVTVRTKESMQKMPFTNFGFSFYDTENWKKNIHHAGLLFIGEFPTNEPLANSGGTEFMVQSLCMIAEKKNS